MLSDAKHSADTDGYQDQIEEEEPGYLHDILTGIENGASVQDKFKQIIIDTCKCGQLKNLKYLLSPRGVERVTRIWGRYFNPAEVDDSGHTAFYYAIRNRDPAFVRCLITGWPTDISQDVLEEVLSSSYHLLKIRDVPIPLETETCIQMKLLELRFSSVSSVSELTSHEHVKERLGLLIEAIDDLLALSNTDELFLYILTVISKNIFVCKKILASTYDRIPWEEMEFCCTALVSSYLNENRLSFIYRWTLSKKKIEDRLRIFLSSIKSIDMSNYCGTECLSEPPSVSRSVVVERILEKEPRFERLYNDFKLVRDFCSLDKINSTVNLALKTNPESREGQLVLIRALLIVGEHLKDSLTSAKLSTETIEKLLKVLPFNTKTIVIGLRNKLAHSYALYNRMAIEKNTKLFVSIQDDLSKMGRVVSILLIGMKSEILRDILRSILLINDPNAEEMDHIIKTVNLLVKFDWNDVLIIKREERLERIIKDLDEAIHQKTLRERVVFDKINEIISSAKKMLKNNLEEFLLNETICASTTENEFTTVNNLEVIKSVATNHLNQIDNRFVNTVFENILNLLPELLKSIFHRLIPNENEISHMFYKLYSYAIFDGKHSDSLGYILKKLNKKDKPAKLARGETINPKTKSNPRSNNCYESISNELKAYLLDNGIDPSAVVSLPETWTDTHRAVAQVFLLDLMSLMESQKKLKSNLLSLDDRYFTLTGKNFRDHLAHHNSLMDILINESDMARVEVLNCLDILSSKVQVERFHTVMNPHFKPRFFYVHDLRFLDSKKAAMFALEEGNLEAFQTKIREGEDILSRDMAHRSLLYYAAKAPNAKVLKVLFDIFNEEGKTISKNFLLPVAVENGSIETVTMLLECGLNVNGLDDHSDSALHIASRKGDTDMIRLLLENGADMTLTNRKGRMPLHSAVINNQKGVVSLLLDMGALVDWRSKGGFTCLHVASRAGHLQLVRLLISEGAGINVKADDFSSPLFSACTNGYFDVAEELLKSGADVKICTLQRYTSLHAAAITGHSDIVNLLLNNGADINAVDDENNATPLYYAACNGFNDIVDSLLKSKADPNPLSPHCLTPFLAAASKGREDVVKTFIKYRIDVNMVSSDEISALHFAAQNGSFELCETLLNEGAEVNAETCNSITPLHLASSAGNDRVVNLLIENKASVDARDKHLLTPLHLAVQSNHSPSVDILLEKGAQVDAADGEGLSPIHKAAMAGAEESATSLLKHSANVNKRDIHLNTPLHLACYFGRPRLIDLLIDGGADVNACEEYDYPPLLKTVEAGDYSILKKLVERGADLKSVVTNKKIIFTAIKNNSKDLIEALLKKDIDITKDGPFYMGTAIFCGFVSMVDILMNKKVVNANSLVLMFPTSVLENVCDKWQNDSTELLDSVKNTKMTPLLLASRYGKNVIVEFLLSKQVDVNATERNGRTALHLAAFYGHERVVEKLLENGADPCLRDVDFKTAFELAVEGGSLPVLDTFTRVESGPVDIEGEDGRTSLHLAANSGKVDVLNFLIERLGNSLMTSRNRDGSMPIHIAAKAGHVQAVVHLLNRGCDIEVTDNAGRTPLHYAAEAGHLSVARLLNDRRAKMDISDESGETPLFLASHRGHRALVEFFLKLGCVLDRRNKEFVKPIDTSFSEIQAIFKRAVSLHAAVKQNSLDEAVNLIKEGTCLNSVDLNCGSSLHIAADLGFSEMASILLRNGCDADIKCDRGTTALHRAVLNNSYDTTILLLSSGAIYNPLSDSGNSPLDLARSENISNLLRFVTDCFDKVKTGDEGLIFDLSEEKNGDKFKVVSMAKDRDDKNILTAAFKHCYSKVTELFYILEKKISTDLAEADSYRTRGRFSEAINLYRANLKSKTDSLEDDDPRIFLLEYEIAMTLYKSNRYDEALELFRTVSAKQNRLFGNDNAYCLKIRSDIARVLACKGWLSKSADLLEETYDKQKLLLGPNHEHSLESRSNLANVYHDLKRYEDAIQINVNIYGIYLRQFGNRHAQTLAVYNNIALNLIGLKKYEKAVEILKEVYEGRKELLGTDHADTTRVLCNIGIALLLDYKIDDAMPYFQRALDNQLHSPEATVLDLFQTRSSIAHILFHRRDFIGAFNSYVECLHIGVPVLGKNHPDILKIFRLKEILNRSLKQAGHDIETINGKIQYELVEAIGKADRLTVKELLVRGADVNGRDAQGMTPIFHCIECADSVMLDILFDKGANVFVYCDRGYTPLHYTILNGVWSILKTLLSRMTQKKLFTYVNLKTKHEGDSALHLAAKEGNIEAVRFLLEHHAVYDATNARGETPLNLTEWDSVSFLLELVEDYFAMAAGGDNRLIQLIEKLDPSHGRCVLQTVNRQGCSLARHAARFQWINLAEAIDEAKHRMGIISDVTSGDS